MTSFIYFHDFKDCVDGNGNLNDYGDNDGGGGGDVVSDDDSVILTTMRCVMMVAMVTVMHMMAVMLGFVLTSDCDNGEGGGGDLLDLKSGSPELNSSTPLC